MPDDLITGAGAGIGGASALLLVERGWKVGAYDLKGVFYGCRAVFPHLQPGAKIVNMCSTSAIYGTSDMATYSATKFGVRGITEALNLEWGESGITVESIWPLYVKTGMLDNVCTDGTDRLGIRLTADDVAAEVADVVERPRGKVARLHTPVGLQTKIMFALSHFSPVCPLVHHYTRVYYAHF
ncbi:SDR family NAD(P)-dependent oxidoreductase [Corynebacterium dentalis]|uniref:SDR family NAD(P)-dependent oxidoreductase n=1 Tax=Corynebacterium dentalis TaxID=2014528 RepID=UPI00289AFA5A|nr:SDR family NAD(P)-dependent oxidoreductase [Corynebacterium dentalis]